MEPSMQSTTNSTPQEAGGLLENAFGIFGFSGEQGEYEDSRGKNDLYYFYT